MKHEISTLKIILLLYSYNTMPRCAELTMLLNQERNCQGKELVTNSPPLPSFSHPPSHSVSLSSVPPLFSSCPSPLFFSFSSTAVSLSLFSSFIFFSFSQCLGLPSLLSPFLCSLPTCMHRWFMTRILCFYISQCKP